MVGKEIYYQQFEKESGSDQVFTVGNPIDLVGNLRALIEQARLNRERREFSEFYPQWWMYDRIGLTIAEYSPEWRRWVQSEAGQRQSQEMGIDTNDINPRNEISDEGLAERQDFFRAIKWAYGIAAYPQFTPRQKDAFRGELRDWIRVADIGSITLNEHQRQILSHIAAATDTPIDTDQTEYHFYTVLRQPDITEKEMQEDPRYATW
jgi:hypothetical protein